VDYGLLHISRLKMGGIMRDLERGSVWGRPGE